MSVIPQTPRDSGGLRPPDPLPGLCLGPAGELKRSPDPSPTHAPPQPQILDPPLSTVYMVKFYDLKYKQFKF
jgi:hypothetical protein